MANNLEKTISQLNRVQKEIDEVREKINLLSKDLKGNKLSAGEDIRKFQAVSKSVNEEFAKLITKEKEFLRIQDQVAKETAKIIAIRSKEARELSKLTLERQKAAKALKAQTAFTSAQRGSIARLTAANKLLRLRQKELNLESEKGRKINSRINQIIDRNTQLIRANSDAMVRQKMNVGNYSQAVDGLRNTWFKFTGIMAGAAGIIGLFRSFNRVIQESNKITNTLRQTTDLSGAALKNATTQVRVIASVYDQEYNDVLKSATVLSNEFGITTDKSLSLIQEGFSKGADVNGEFLELLKEYPAQLKSVGLNAEQTIAIITQTERAGVFSDKGIDAIKEAGVRLRELAPATEVALNAIGLSSKEIEESLRDGSKTLFQVTQDVSAQLAKLPPQSKEVGQAIADIFGGPGEDAGLRYLTTLKDIDVELDNIEDNSTDLTIAQRNLNEQWTIFNETIASGEGAIGRIITAFVNLDAAILESLNLLHEYTVTAQEAGIETEGLEGFLNALSGRTGAFQLMNQAVKSLSENLGENVLDFELFKAATEELRKEYAKLGVQLSDEDISLFMKLLIESGMDAKTAMSELNKEMGAGSDSTLGIIKQLEKELAGLDESLDQAKTIEQIQELNVEINNTAIALKNLKAGIEAPDGQIELIPIDPEPIKEEDREKIIANILQTRDEIRAEIGVGETNLFLESLGITPENEELVKQQFSNFINNTRNFLSQLAQIRLDAANKELALREANVKDLEDKIRERGGLRKEEKELSLSELRSQLAEQEEARQKALEEQEKAQKTQQNINDLQQVSAISTAAANLIQGWSTIPFIGQVLGAASVAAMIAGFIAAKASANQSVKAEDGLGMLLDGGSHASGKDISLGDTGVRAEGKEFMSIFSKDKTKKYGAERLSMLTNAINSGKVSASSMDMMLSGLGSGIIVNSHQSNDSKIMEQLLGQIVSNTNESADVIGNKTIYKNKYMTKIKI